jgi:hypothetical protein
MTSPRDPACLFRGTRDGLYGGRSHASPDGAGSTTDHPEVESMSSALPPDALIATVLMIPTVFALLHLARFPYVRSTAIPAWFLAIVAVPAVGPAAWWAYAFARAQHAKLLVEELTTSR